MRIRIDRICTWILFGFFLFIFSGELLDGFFYWPTLVVILLMLPIVFNRKLPSVKVRRRPKEPVEEKEEELDYNLDNYTR